jgi:hypothetical protein
VPNHYAEHARRDLLSYRNSYAGRTQPSKEKDAQLEAAIQQLEKLIKEKPFAVPEPPDYPDKQ